MKLGAIIWGLPENYNVTVYNKLGKILKTITESQLTKIGIHKEHTLWLGSCYETELTLLRESDTVSMELSANGSKAYGSKDPRDYLKHFKAEGFTHIMLLQMPVLIGLPGQMNFSRAIVKDLNLDKLEEYIAPTGEAVPANIEAITNLLNLIDNKESIHFIAQPNHMTAIADDWDLSPIIVDLRYATHEFMLFNKPLANINEDNIKSYDFGSVGMHTGDRGWVSDVKASAFLRVLEATTPNKDDIEEVLTGSLELNIYNEDILLGLCKSIKEINDA